MHEKVFSRYFPVKLDLISAPLTFIVEFKPMSHAFADLLKEAVEHNVSQALLEDVGAGDLTAALVPESVSCRARIISREAGVLCGRAWVECCFNKLDPTISMTWQVADGDVISPGQQLCELHGPARNLLTGERTALNFLQLLSGVATRTRQYVDIVAGTSAQIVDTRKTLPGLRVAQKYAVLCGGGGNHRMGLHDAILIKENHILAAGGITPAMDNARKEAVRVAGRCRFIQIEVETLDQLNEALEAGAQMILLDNMSVAQMREAVSITAERAVLEASGNISLETLRTIAQTGVNRISIGRLTKDVEALDLSMRFEDR